MAKIVTSEIALVPLYMYDFLNSDSLFYSYTGTNIIYNMKRNENMINFF